VRQTLLTDFDLEIGAGLGEFAGKAWRVGLMGQSASRRHVLACLVALGSALAAQARAVDREAALAAAQSVYG
jgi:alanine-glyoxylate transaminase/serine-glyoxylate transaminase/serine-pyruvate transaminase